MYLTIPGIGGSGPDHWQSLWESAEPEFARIEQEDWDRPDLAVWTDRAQAVLSERHGPAILVAHSLGCLMVPHLAALPPHVTARVVGALLVSMPDPVASAFPKQEAATFVTIPKERLPFPVLVVASANDPFGSVAHARDHAVAWGGRCVEIGDFGHINAQSGLGAWPEGRRLLEAFRAGLAV
ncbi:MULTISPECIES: alpha/beta hydrolase [unclassified Roseitalea]|uniref:RBBP9/YdeN family alpha/beta hydrolase n=1 Tax=unclassified Roseitalea TaxID=2639107 RepID=UPI00273DF9F7|nr:MULTISPECIES: alpha/beta hydrolase [unclassified Roseitalea]